MPRSTRTFDPGVSIHIIQRGNNRMPVFERDTDYEMFLLILAKAAKRDDVAVHAYVLMTNHYHLLITPNTRVGTARMMKHVDGRYAAYFNRQYARVGTPWNGRYRGIPISDEAYWLTCSRYIEQNPVRAGMVRTPDKYPWSSYTAHAEGLWPEWMTPHPLYRAMGRTAPERQLAYRAVFGSPLPQHVVQILQ